MKRIIVNSVAAICLMCTLLSCSKNDPENIFKGLNKEALVPLDIEEVLGQELASSLDYRNNDFFVISSILERTGVSEKIDSAIVINDVSILDGLCDKDGKLLDFSGIDFEKYSIVVGQERMVNYNPVVREIRAIVKEKSITLYTEVVSSDTWAQSSRLVYFASLFQKLPDYSIEIVRWENLKEHSH